MLKKQQTINTQPQEHSQYRINSIKKRLNTQLNHPNTSNNKNEDKNNDRSKNKSNSKQNQTNQRLLVSTINDKYNRSYDKIKQKRKYYTDASENKIKINYSSSNAKQIEYQVNQQQAQQNQLYNNSISNRHDKQLQTISQKDKLLQTLTKKNKILKQNIYRIQKIQQQSQNSSKIKKQHDFTQIYYAFSTKDSLQSELKNAYIKINRIQDQIKDIRKILNKDEKTTLNKLKERMEQIHIVKQQRTNKLEEIRKLNKRNQEKIQKFKNGLYQDHIGQLNKQCQYLRDKQKDMIAAEEKRKVKVKKQQEYIKKLQKQLVDTGVSKQYLMDLMNKIQYKQSRSAQRSQSVGSKSVYDIRSKQANVQQIKQNHQSKQALAKQYKRLQHEINLFKKLIKQQEKYIEQIGIQEKSALQRQSKAKSLAYELDETIKNIQAEIAQKRKSINPLNLRPKVLPPKQESMQQRKKQQNQHLREYRKKFYEKKTKRYMQSIQNPNEQVNQFDEIKQKSQRSIKGEDQSKSKKEQEQIKIKIQGQGQGQNSQINQAHQSQQSIEIYGIVDKQGVKFTDKQIQTKIKQESSQTQCKIAGMKVLILNNNIMGIQAIYNHKIYGRLHRYAIQEQQLTQSKQGEKNDKNKNMNRNSFKQQNIVVDQQFICVQDQYVVSISGTFSGQSLANLTILTNLNRYHKFGYVLPKDQNQKTQSKQKQKNILQFQICNSAQSYPSYIMGCVNKFGICQFGAKIVRQEQEEQYQQNNQQQNEIE